MPEVPLPLALAGTIVAGVLVVPMLRRMMVRRYLHGWTADFIASRQFLDTPEWKSVRYQAIRANDGQCECCGHTKHDGTGVRLNVDHIKPRARYPELALAVSNLQVLCGDCNRGKGNRFEDDWRASNHLHRLLGRGKRAS